MPYAKGTFIPTSDGSAFSHFISLDRGWLTAVSIFPRTDAVNILGPEYGQIFISFGNPVYSSKAIVLNQGYINNTDAVYWTGKQLVEDDMFLGFLIKSFIGDIINFGYFIEKYCPPIIPDNGLRTDVC